MDLSNAAIVVAHPDDEILWFSSIVPSVKRIVMCYGNVIAKPERARQRRDVLKNYPLHTVKFLDIPEPGNIASEAEDVARFALLDGLRVCLGSVETVFTHNSWGEYGHMDHKRVHAAVRILQKETNFALFVSSYIHRQMFDSVIDGLNSNIDSVVSFPVDRQAIESIFQLYKANSCWTWATNWTWPRQENFFKLGDRQSRGPTAIPVQVICS